MSIYTRRGDSGTTNLLGRSRRVPKTHPIFATLGSLDELNSHLGIVISLLRSETSAKEIPNHPNLPNLDPQHQISHLQDIQHHLFTLGTLLQSPSPNTPNSLNISSSTKQLEKSIDQLSKDLPPLKNFLLPGGHPAAAQLHLARAVCRRAEHTAVKLHPPKELLAYLNRLSDYLFTLARWVNHQTHQPETLFTPHSSSQSSPHKTAPKPK